MILVDSSVWIDYFRNVSNPHTQKLEDLLGRRAMAIGDLVLVEVLQGVRNDGEFHRVRRSLSTLQFVVLGGADLSVKAAMNFRKLRALGITVRKTIDTLIATRCIESGYELLHNDRDFDGFERHLGLRCVIPSH